jgi:hypothetical protein
MNYQELAFHSAFIVHPFLPPSSYSRYGLLKVLAFAEGKKPVRQAGFLRFIKQFADTN